MEKGIKLFGLFLLLSVFSVSYVFAATASFHSMNSPPGGDPFITCGTLSKCNGLTPVTISSSGSDVGKILKLSNIVGQTCPRIYLGPCSGASGQCDRTCNVCAEDGDNSASCATNSQNKIGFYNSENILIAKYPLSSFVGTGIVVPVNTKYIYAYLDEDDQCFADNNINTAFSCTFDYTIGATCKTCAVDYVDQCGAALDDGCGGTLNCATNCGTGKTCSNNVCVSSEVPVDCVDDQIILRLNSSVSYNASLATTLQNTDFNFKVCYDKIFGSAYVLPGGIASEQLRACNGRNNIINLSLPVGGRAGVNGTYSNQNKICYGDLVCRSIDTSKGEACIGTEKVIVALNNLTNASIANRSYSGYNIQVCCKPIISSGGAVWQNMIGMEIFASSFGDSVKMVRTGTEFEGKNIIYTVTNSGIIPFLTKRIAQFTSMGYGVWKVNTTGDDIKFTAEVEENADISTSSNNLKVFSTTPSNSLPSITITNPVEERIYVINSTMTKTIPINFTQNASDVDDDLSVTWNFADGTSPLIISNCLSGTNCNTTHEYTTSGTKIITASTNEMTRTQSDYDKTRIYVYKPGYNLIIRLDSPDYKKKWFEPGKIELDARNTKLVQCFSTITDCFGGGAAQPGLCNRISEEGRCPTCEGSCLTSDACTVFCRDVLLSNDVKMSFDWTVDNVLLSNHTAGPIALYYPQGGRHNINLKVRATYP